jgi:hypothetical protein
MPMVGGLGRPGHRAGNDLLAGGAGRFSSSRKAVRFAGRAG